MGIIQEIQTNMEQQEEHHLFQVQALQQFKQLVVQEVLTVTILLIQRVLEVQVVLVLVEI